MTPHDPPEQWKLSARCRCGRAEGRRVFAWIRDSYLEEDPRLPVEKVECRCGRRYVIQAQHYQNATLDGPESGR